MAWNPFSFFKYNPLTDGDQTFNIDQALNQNWDKILARDEEVRAAIDDANDLISTHTGKTVSKYTTATRDISITGTQKISLPFAAKSISILAYINNSKNYCHGFCDNTLAQGGVLMAGHTGNVHTGAKAIHIFNDVYTVVGEITAIEEDGITITWTIATGTVPASTTLTMRILAQTH